MGVSIMATNSSYDFSMGCGGFFNLRKNVALALDKDFGETYSLRIKCFTTEQITENDRAAEEIINRKKLDNEYEDVLDFLYMADCDGKISYKTCRKIYDLIKDKDFGKNGFQYATYQNDDWETFKKFLLECYSKRRCMRWH